jgi:hypothetical protein
MRGPHGVGSSSVAGRLAIEHLIPRDPVLRERLGAAGEGHCAPAQLTVSFLVDGAVRPLHQLAVDAIRLDLRQALDPSLPPSVVTGLSGSQLMRRCEVSLD